MEILLVFVYWTAHYRKTEALLGSKQSASTDLIVQQTAYRNWCKNSLLLNQTQYLRMMMETYWSLFAKQLTHEKWKCCAINKVQVQVWLGNWNHLPKINRKTSCLIKQNNTEWLWQFHGSLRNNTLAKNKCCEVNKVQVHVWLCNRPNVETRKKTTTWCCSFKQNNNCRRMMMETYWTLFAKQLTHKKESAISQTKCKYRWDWATDLTCPKQS